MRPGGRWSIFNKDIQWDFDLKCELRNASIALTIKRKLANFLILVFRRVVIAAYPILRQELLNKGQHAPEVSFTEDVFIRCVCHYGKLKKIWT
jgi:hypothetical protein